MIRLYLVLVLVLALGATAANYLLDDNGYVLVAYHNWLLETSLAGLVSGILVGGVALYALVKLLFASISLPGRIRAALERRRAERARDSFETGLLQLLEGNWKRAEVELVRRASDHRAAHLNYLAAARAAQRIGATERRDHYLQLAAQNAPGNEFAMLLTQAELQRERGELTLARDTALRLRERDPRHPYAIELLAECYAGIGGWDALRQLLTEPAAQNALPEARHTELLSRALCALMDAAARDGSLEQLRAVRAAAPSNLRSVPAVRLHYARGLARVGADAEALALISQTLNKEWDADLAALFGTLTASEPLTQLAAIEQWLNLYGEKPELLVAAGRACLRNKLWGKARSYLEAVTRVTPSAAAYLELARLCEQTQNPEEAGKFYRQGLELAAQA